MTRLLRRTGIALTAAITMGVGATAAQAAPAQTATGNVTSGPVKMAFEGQRGANTNANQATGTFEGRMVIGSLGLMSVKGPITCMDVRGPHVGIFYPIKQSSVPLLDKGLGVYMNITTDGKGNAKRVAYSVVPRKAVPSCAPAPTFLPATGFAALTS